MSEAQRPAATPKFATVGDKGALETGDVFAPRFDADGLIPAIVTDEGTGDVLMFAWMNAEALHLTISTGIAHFWSRSRGKLWKKGEESGNVLAVADMLTDCDQDVVIVKVDIGGAGRACHTGEKSCFYRRVVATPGEAAAARLQPLAESDLAKRRTT